MPNSLNRNTVIENNDIKNVTTDWGWQNPPVPVLEMASEALRLSKEKCGETLVRWKALDGNERDQLLQAKPERVPTLRYFSEQEPIKVLPYVEKLLALSKHYPFYDSLNVLSPHQGMFESAILRRCEELDAILMQVDSGIPVLVFSQFDHLQKYSLLGHQERLNDPICQKNDFNKPLLAVGSRDHISSALKAFKNSDDQSVEATLSIWNANSEEFQTPEGRELGRIFDHALSTKATDISFKPVGENGSIRVRIRKWRRLVNPFKSETPTIFQSDTGTRILNLLSAKSGANPHHLIMRQPSDGQISYKSQEGNAFFRLGFIPLNRLGEVRDYQSLALRIFSREKQVITFDELNVPDSVATMIREALQAPQGFILISGPMNSGKSSLIAAAVGEHVKLYGDTLERISLEDPVEREIEGITQLNLPKHLPIDEAYDLMMKGIKRHDLDLFWLGEIRDKQGAEFCTTIGSSGHLVFSSIHAENSIMAFHLLSQMVDAGTQFQLSEAMSMSISTRLIRTLCPHCSEKDQGVNEAEKRLFHRCLDMLGENQELPPSVSRAGNGCDECENGYSGFAPIFEILVFNRKVKNAAISLLKGERIEEQREILANARTITLLESAIELLKTGVVDVPSIIIA